MALQVDQLRAMARAHGRETAYVQLASSDLLTFERWDQTSNRLARALTDAGVGLGDRVVLHVANEHLDRWVISYAAIHKAGAVAVPTNTRLTARELGVILGHAQPVAAITSTGLAGPLDEGLAAADGGEALRLRLIADTDQWCDTLADDTTDYQVAVDEGDLADIMYTSGTTGLPKGVAVRHRNSHIIPNRDPTWSGDSWIHCSPLSTFAGISFVYNPMKMGMRGLYLPRFDADRWFDAVEQWRPTMAFVVPAMVQLLLTHPRWAHADLTSLKVLSIGSAPLAPTLHRQVAERLGDAMVTNNYSMTEAGTAFTYLPPGQITERPGSVGIPLAPTEVRIADPDGEALPTGEVGEVLIGVGEHHREYYRDPEATAATWSGPWLRSGDLGRVDEDGYLYIVGRAKDIIIRGGNNVAATEVEGVLYEHPGVLEAAVAGIPHDVLGEDVGAFVVARPDVTLDADELIAFCRERLADYKVPRRVQFLDELPRNATGKVLKRDLPT